MENVGSGFLLGCSIIRSKLFSLSCSTLTASGLSFGVDVLCDKETPHISVDVTKESEMNASAVFMLIDYTSFNHLTTPKNLVSVNQATRGSSIQARTPN